MVGSRLSMDSFPSHSSSLTIFLRGITSRARCVSSSVNSTSQSSTLRVFITDSNSPNRVSCVTSFLVRPPPPSLAVPVVDDVRHRHQHHVHLAAEGLDPRIVPAQP